MTNQLFMSMTAAKKQKKLISVLQRRTRGALTKGELHRLLLAIRQNRQHKIIVHTDPKNYHRALTMTGKTGYGRRRQIILGDIDKHPIAADELLDSLCPSAAIITTKTDMTGFRGLFSTVHIYIPKRLYQKRRGTGI